MSDSEALSDDSYQRRLEEKAIEAVVDWIVTSKLRRFGSTLTRRILRSERTLIVDGEDWHMAWRENTGGAVGGYDVCYHGIMWSEFVEKLKEKALPVLIQKVESTPGFDGVTIEWDFTPPPKR